MGYVYEARDERLGRDVAIKFMVPKALREPNLRKRFLREARAASRISSAHSVEIFDLCELDDGTPFIVMELLHGVSLESVLASRGGRLPTREAVTYVLAICDALTDAHAKGIIHRDIKPANVFLDERKGIKVVDFGIAKFATQTTSSGVSLTVAGGLVGTPHYMSPEQFDGKDEIGASTDIWAIGAILYEMLAGKPPFDANTLEELKRKVLQEDPVPLVVSTPEVPPSLAEVVTRCLEKKPSQRYATIGELAGKLVAVTANRKEDSTHSGQHDGDDRVVPTLLSSPPVPELSDGPRENEPHSPDMDTPIRARISHGDMLPRSKVSQLNDIQPVRDDATRATNAQQACQAQGPKIESRLPPPEPSRDNDAIGSGAENRMSVLDQVGRDSVRASLTFAVPKAMRWKAKNQVRLSICSKRLISDFERIAESSRALGVRILPAPRMRAILEGKYFKIHLQGGDPERALEKVLEANWTWDVTPDAWGAQELTLTVMALVLVEGQSAPEIRYNCTERVNVSATRWQKLRNQASRIDGRAATLAGLAIAAATLSHELWKPTVQKIHLQPESNRSECSLLGDLNVVLDDRERTVLPAHIDEKCEAELTVTRAHFGKAVSGFRLKRQCERVDVPSPQPILDGSSWPSLPVTDACCKQQLRLSFVGETSCPPSAPTEVELTLFDSRISSARTARTGRIALKNCTAEFDPPPHICGSQLLGAEFFNGQYPFELADAIPPDTRLVQEAELPLPPLRVVQKLAVNIATDANCDKGLPKSAKIILDIGPDDHRVGGAGLSATSTEQPSVNRGTHLSVPLNRCMGRATIPVHLLGKAIVDATLVDAGGFALSIKRPLSFSLDGTNTLLFDVRRVQQPPTPIPTSSSEAHIFDHPLLTSEVAGPAW